MRLLLFAALVQRVDASPPAVCGAAAQPLSEFEVSQPARFAAVAREGPRPVRRLVSSRRVDIDSVVVRFVVDTMGIPVPRTFEVLRSPSSDVTNRVRDAHVAWRFRPARLGGCKVPQVVQTPVDWGPVPNASPRAPP